MTPRFEVDYKQRLEQSRTATNAVRMPRLGYARYRVYVIEQPKKESSVSAGWYSGSGGKSSYNISVSKSRQSGKSQANWQQVLWAFIDELETKIEPAYEVKWLKPKQATLLRIRGHRVELAELGDKGFKTGVMRLGR